MLQHFAVAIEVRDGSVTIIDLSPAIIISLSPALKKIYPAPWFG